MNQPGTDPERTGTDEFSLNRRHVLIAGGLSVGMLAGCIDLEDVSPSDGSTTAGTFRLLISDQPNAIDDFDQLNVSFDHARVFTGEDNGTPDGTLTPTPEPTPTPNETETPTTNETPTVTPTPTPDPTPNETPTVTPDETPTETPGNETDTPDDDDDQGFFTIDLEGESVDLTEVVGEKAIGVFEGELETGTYQKLELHVEEVEGILVEGGTAEVKVPSEKLQIVRPFEVEAGETVTFVFDINVVARGNTGMYNLLPVISGSGINGEDVDVEEVDRDDDDENGDNDENDDDEDDEDDEDEDENDQ